MGPGQEFLTRVKGQFFVAGVESGQPSWVWKIFQKNSSVWVKKHPGQRWVILLFSVGQKYAWVRSGPISSLMPT